MSQPSGVPRQIRIISDSLQRRFEKHLDISDITHPEPAQRHGNMLSRALAAAIVADHAGCDDDRAAEMVTDGAQDFGVDAVAFTTAGSRLWLVQTKWNHQGGANFREADVMTMADGLRKIDQREFDRFNPKFKKLTSIIRESDGLA